MSDYSFCKLSISTGRRWKRAELLLVLLYAWPVSNTGYAAPVPIIATTSEITRGWKQDSNIRLNSARFDIMSSLWFVMAVVFANVQSSFADTFSIGFLSRYMDGSAINIAIESFRANGWLKEHELR